MKIVIIGAVAAGTSAAVKARRNDEYADITIYEMDYDIWYSACGLPYYIGTEVESLEQLVPVPEWLEEENVFTLRNVGSAEGAEVQYQKAHVEGAVSLPQEVIRTVADGLEPTKHTVTYCNKGVTGNAAQNILINRGFTEVYNLSGGHKHYSQTSNENDSKG